MNFRKAVDTWMPKNFVINDMREICCRGAAAINLVMISPRMNQVQKTP